MLEHICIRAIEQVSVISLWYISLKLLLPNYTYVQNDQLLTYLTNCVHECELHECVSISATEYIISTSTYVLLHVYEHMYFMLVMSTTHACACMYLCVCVFV